MSFMKVGQIIKANFGANVITHFAIISNYLLSISFSLTIKHQRKLIKRYEGYESIGRIFQDLILHQLYLYQRQFT